MISIIICSVNESLLQQIRENIALTIGYPYEILVRKNKNGNKGLCAVYNELAKDAKGDFLCFVHEDVIFKTMDWGKEMVKKGIDKTTGVIGFAGSRNISGIPYWHDEENQVYHYVQKKDGGQIVADYTNRKLEKPFAEVAVLDGMFLFCRKEVWNEFKFDEEIFRKFHLYDIDFTFAVSRHYKNYVCVNVTIEHLSLGNVSIQYYENLTFFYKKWHEVLPVVKAERKMKLIVLRLIIEMSEKVKLSNLFVLDYLKNTGEMKCVKSVLYIYYCLVKTNVRLFVKGLKNA